MKKRYAAIEHTADIEIVAYGENLKQLFVNALHGMFDAAEPRFEPCYLVVGQTLCYESPIIRDIDVSAPDLKTLLVDFLSESLYLSDVHDEAYLEAQIEMLTDTRVIGSLQGTTVTGFGTEIKAVTFHGLSIEEQADGTYAAHVVFDI